MILKMNLNMEYLAESVQYTKNGNVITIKNCNVWVISDYGSSYFDSIETTVIDGVQQNVTFNPCELFVISQKIGRMISERIIDLMKCENE